MCKVGGGGGVGGTGDMPIVSTPRASRFTTFAPTEPLNENATYVPIYAELKIAKLQRGCVHVVWNPAA